MVHRDLSVAFDYNRAFTFILSFLQCHLKQLKKKRERDRAAKKERKEEREKNKERMCQKNGLINLSLSLSLSLCRYMNFLVAVFRFIRPAAFPYFSSKTRIMFSPNTPISRDQQAGQSSRDQLAGLRRGSCVIQKASW